MRPITSHGNVSQSELEAILLPRDDVVVERAADTDVFHLADGPFRSYERRVTIAPLADGTFDVTQTITGDVAIPYWGFLFRGVLRRQLAQLGPAPAPGDSRGPWWAPPDRLDERAARTLAALALLSVVIGYGTYLLSQTITYAADEFGATKAAQGFALSAVRIDILIALPVMALTDRRGRRRILLIASAAGLAVTALGALAPTLPGLIATQVPARGLLSAGTLVITIMAAEEMPSGARAYAIGLLSMAGALGSGLCILLLPIADLGTSAWRILFALALIGILPLRDLATHLHETRRFEAQHADAGVAGHGSRLWLLAVSAFLLAVFFTPLLQFTNEFLRDERHYNGAGVSAFNALTGIPGAIGIIVGGRLADIHGRRIIGAIGLAFGAALGVAQFVAAGITMWMWSSLGSVLGAAIVPALGVYGPELFPTALRGRANAIIALLGRFGSVVGLITVGVVSDHHTFGYAFSLVSIGPILLAVLVIAAYPETAHRSLEDINPEDRGGGAPPN